MNASTLICPNCEQEYDSGDLLLSPCECKIELRYKDLYNSVYNSQKIKLLRDQFMEAKVLEVEARVAFESLTCKMPTGKWEAVHKKHKAAHRRAVLAEVKFQTELRDGGALN